MSTLNDIEAERAFLASVLLDPNLLELSGLGPTVMTGGDTQHTLSAMLAVRGRGEPVDTVSVCTELERRGWPKARAFGFLLPLTEKVPPPARSLVARLRLLAEARRIQEYAAAGMSAVERLELDEARERLSGAIFGGESESEVMTGRQAMEAAAESWKEISEEELRAAQGLPAKYIKLTFGRHQDGRPVEVTRAGPGDLVTVGAPTGVGKSSMAWTMMAELEDRDYRPGLVYIEESPDKWGAKFIGHRGGVNTAGFWRGIASGEDWRKASTAVGAVNKRDHVRLVQAKTATIEEVVAHMCRLVRVHHVQVLFVDYLQAISCPSARGATRRDTIDLVLARLTQTARMLDVPLVLMSQFSRPEKGNPFKEPHLNDLKESGTLENTSDEVVLMWILTDDKNDPNHGVVCAKLAKTRMLERGDRWALKRSHGQVLTEIEGWRMQDGGL